MDSIYQSCMKKYKDFLCRFAHLPRILLNHLRDPASGDSPTAAHSASKASWGTAAAMKERTMVSFIVVYAMWWCAAAKKLWDIMATSTSYNLPS